MQEILNIFTAEGQHDELTRIFSLEAQLEAIVGGYYVSGAGMDEWVQIYYDKTANPEKTTLREIAKPENIIAYVSENCRKALVLKAHHRHFKEDSKGCGLAYFSFSSFEEEIYCCNNPAALPLEFQNIVWIEDDFLEDEAIPFDFEAFEVIDTGTKYLNPRHFSINQMMNYLYADYRLKK